MKKQSALNGVHILVVDDEVELREALIFDLKRRGAIIFEAGSGFEAIEIAKNNKVEIVISDVRMPNGSGVDLLKSLRAANPDIPFVLLATGFADLTEPEALRIGAQALMEKPIERLKLLSILEDFCTQVKKAA